MINQYIVNRKLGEGAFGKVMLCKDISKNDWYAIKQMNKKELKKKLDKSRSKLAKR